VGIIVRIPFYRGRENHWSKKGTTLEGKPGYLACSAPISGYHDRLVPETTSLFESPKGKKKGGAGDHCGNDPVQAEKGLSSGRAQGH